MTEEYFEYRAECRACGVEPETFTEWSRTEEQLRVAAYERIGNIWDAQDAQEAY